MVSKKQLRKQLRKAQQKTQQSSKIKAAAKSLSDLSSAQEKRLRDEIKQLEAKRKDAGFLRKLAINKAISDRTRIFKQRRNIMGLKHTKEELDLKTAIAKKKAELQEARKKGMMTEEDIFGDQLRKDEQNRCSYKCCK